MKKSKIIILIAAIILVALTVVAVAAATISESTIGIINAIINDEEYDAIKDLNGDGEINIFDVILGVKKDNFGGPGLATLTLEDGYKVVEEVKYDTFNYTVKLPAGRPRIPHITATADVKNAVIAYQNATIADNETFGYAKVIISDNSGENVYTVKFERAEVVDTVVLQYDDRWTFKPDYELKEGEAFTFESSNAAVAAVDANGVITAKDVSSEAVVISAKVAGETVDTFTVAKVDKAVINLFLVTGQSNAQGCYDFVDTDGDGTKEDSEKFAQSTEQIQDVLQPDKAGQVYIYDARPYWNSYNTTDDFVLQGGLSAFYDLYDVKRAGFASALGKTYYDLSGEKVVFLHAAYNGSCIERWLDPAKYPDIAEDYFNHYVNAQNAYTELMKKLDSSKYEINHRANFWLQGETCMGQIWDYTAKSGLGDWRVASEYEKRFSAEEYADMFMKLHGQLKADFRIETNNILLVRAHSSENKIKGVLAAINNVRASQYGMANSNPEITIVSRFSDFAVKNNPSLYNGTIYEQYMGTMGVGDVHYNQTGHNINGIWAATNYFKKIDVDRTSGATSVEIIDSNGVDRFEANAVIGEFEVGKTKRIAAFALPEYSLEDVTYKSSNESVANINEYGLITIVGVGEATITATSESGKSSSIVVKGKARTTAPVAISLDGFTTKTIASYLPEFRFADITYTSDNEKVATISNDAVITPVGSGTATIKATSCTGAYEEFVVTVTTTSKTAGSVHYRWDFNGNLKSSADENDLVLSTKSASNGAASMYMLTPGTIYVNKDIPDLNKPDFTMTYPVTVSSETDWAIEWRAQFTENSVILGVENATTTINSQTKYVNHIYAIYGKKVEDPYFQNVIYPLRFNDCNGNEIFLSYINGTYADMNKSMNTWKLDYKKYTGKMTLSVLNNNVWTIVDVVEPGEFTATYNNVLGRYHENGMVNFEGHMDYIDIKVGPAEVLYDTHYRWDFEAGKEYDSTYDKNTLTLTNPSKQIIADGKYQTTTTAGEVKLEKPIVFDTKHDWMLEIKFTSPTNNNTLFGTENCYATGTDRSHLYFAASTWGGVIRIEDDASNDYEFTVPFDNPTAVQAALRNMNTWRIGYDMSTNTMSVWLYDEATGTWNEVGKKESVPAFTLTATCMFGDYDGKDKVSMNGTVEYVDVLIEANKTVTDTHYRWDFEAGKEYDSTYDKNTLKKTDSNHSFVTVDNGQAYKTTTRAGELKMEEPIVLDNKHNWMMEFKFQAGHDNNFLIGRENCYINSSYESHIYFSLGGYQGINFEPDPGAGSKITVKFDDNTVASNAAKNAMNTWRIGYDVDTKTITIWLYNTETSTWDAMGSKTNVPDFTLTADCLFGDWDGADKYNMIGTVDYFEVLVENSKQETDCGVYTWEFDKLHDGKLVSSADSNSLTIPSTTEYTLSNGQYVVAKAKQAELALEKSIKLDSTHDWYIEWRSAFNKHPDNKKTDNCIILGTDNSQGKYNFIYAAPGTSFGAGRVGVIRVNDAKGGEKYLEYVDGATDLTASTNLSKEWNTWRLQYDCETKTLSFLKLNTTTYAWETCDSVVWDNISFEFTHVFGDFGSATQGDNWVNFRGSIDYLKVSYKK